MYFKKYIDMHLEVLKNQTEHLWFVMSVSFIYLKSCNLKEDNLVNLVSIVQWGASSSHSLRHV